MQKLGVIFDLDGTLWDSSKQVVPAWNRVLGRHPELHKYITIEDMKRFMGKTIEKIAELMLPQVTDKKRLEIMKECCAEEQIYLGEHGATLYPGLEVVLEELSRHYFLGIVSNCQDGYVQTFLEFHKLQKYFSDIEMSGRTGKSKGENIYLLMQRNNLTHAMYVGDTMGDYEAAAEAGVPFIHASYGFGKVDHPQYSICNISELTQVVRMYYLTTEIEK